MFETGRARRRMELQRGQSLPVAMYDQLADPPMEWIGEQVAPTRPAPAGRVNWCQIRQAIAATARAEDARWTRPNGTKILEGDPSRLPILTRYWSAVPGFGTPAAAARAAQLSANNVLDGEWSAAFICFVMRTSGVQRAHGFEFAQRHMNYIVGALRNRERSDRTRPFWLVDRIELQQEAVPERGDLLCFNRVVNGVMTNHSYESLRRRFWSGGNQNTQPSGSSHCALVVGQLEDRGRRFVETIGGNERQSVRRQRIPVDQSGRIPNPRALNIFGMIKLIEC